MAARNNEAASIAIHGVSAFYNIGQVAHYRMLCTNYKTSLVDGSAQVSADMMGQYKQELIKHTLLAGLDIFTLFAIGLSGVHRNNNY